MTKSRNAKDGEFHKSIIRAQKKEIRRLQQEIKQLKKFTYDPKEKNVFEEIDDKPLKCTNCGKGFLKEVEFGSRIFTVCQTCSERKKIK